MEAKNAGRAKAKPASIGLFTEPIYQAIQKENHNILQK